MTGENSVTGNPDTNPSIIPDRDNSTRMTSQQGNPSQGSNCAQTKGKGNHQGVARAVVQEQEPKTVLKKALNQVKANPPLTGVDSAPNNPGKCTRPFDSHQPQEQPSVQNMSKLNAA